MKISGFTYIRNGFYYQYPFIASINSLLPIVDELVVVVGNSSDCTKEAIEALNNDKIKIVDSIWDDSLRIGGEIFAEQSNIGIKNSTGDWLIHLQADEVLMEDTKSKILKCIQKADTEKNVDGILFPFLHFWGDYQHIRNTRRTHRFEIRAFKNNRDIFSYRDSQGFRKYSNRGKGKKLNVIETDVRLFHYSYTRHPRLMKKKSNYFQSFWHSDNWIAKNTDGNQFDFNEVDRLDLYIGKHPKYMQEIIAKKDWKFNYDPSKSKSKLTDMMLNIIEKHTGYRLFEYKNYNLIS